MRAVPRLGRTKSALGAALPGYSPAQCVIGPGLGLGAHSSRYDIGPRHLMSPAATGRSDCSACSHRADLPSRSRALLDARREQADYLSDARRTDIRAAAGRIDPAEVGLAVELRQGIEECPRPPGWPRAPRRYRRQDHRVAGLPAPAQRSRRRRSRRPCPAGASEPGSKSNPLPDGKSLARIRQPSIVPPTGWLVLAPHASSGSNGIVMTAVSPGPAAMTARKR